MSLQSVAVEERVSQINKELAEFKQRLDRAETVYNDETRVRQIVEGLVEPIILIAKQNALTNCYKNDELQGAREEMKDLNERMVQFRKQLDVLHEYEHKLVRTEERLASEITKAHKTFEPARKIAGQCRDEVTEIKNKVKEIKLTLQQREQRLIDLESLFIDHQKETREDVMKRVQQNIDVIEQMHPKIQHITNLSTECTQYYNTTKEEFAEMHQSVHENHTLVATIQNELEDLKNAQLKDLKHQILNSNTQMQEIFKQLTNSNLRMTQIDEGFNQLTKQIQDLTRFAIFSQPTLTHLQISDVLQEFLCVPDQMKLIEFDAQKLGQISKFRSKFEESGTLGLQIQKLHNQLRTLEALMAESKNGCLRINFQKDIQLNAASSSKREQQMRVDLQSKGDLIKKIYRFEKQMFLAQKKLTGQIPQTQELVDEIFMRDTRGYAQQHSHRGAAAEQMDLINLQDPNHRLKQFLRYQNQSNLSTVQLENARIQKEMEEAQYRQPKSAAKASAPGRDKARQKSGPSRSHPLASVDLIQKQTVGAQEAPKEKSEKQEVDPVADVQSQQAATVAAAQGLTDKERMNLVDRLANPALSGHPDFHMLPEENSCSRCGLRNRRFGNVPNNNHMHGSGMQNVIYEVVFVRSQTKIDRMQHRFLAKKRNWLTRQIDPSKRYLHALNKQARIREIQRQENLEFGDDQFATVTFDQAHEQGFGEMDGHAPGGDTEHDQDGHYDSADHLHLQGLRDQESADTGTDDQHLDDDKDAESSPRIAPKEMHIESNSNSVSTIPPATPIRQLRLDDVDEEKEHNLPRSKAQANRKQSAGRKAKESDLADAKRHKATRRAGALEREDDRPAANSKQLLAADADSKRSDAKSAFDPGKQEGLRAAQAHGVKNAPVAGGYLGEALLNAKSRQGSSGPRQDSSARRAAEGQKRTVGFDVTKIQQLMQAQLLKLKGQMDQNVLSNVSAVQGAFQGKVHGLTQRLEQVQQAQAEQRQLTDSALARNFEILEKRMIKLEHNHDFLDDLIKQMQEKYDSALKKQHDAVERFKKFVSEEYVDFFKNRRRIKMELVEHSKEYKNKFQVLAGLCNEFSFKFNYVDAILPVLAEQNRFTYNIMLQDMSVRESLSKTLSQAQTPAHNGYLLLEQIRASQGSGKMDQIGKELLNLQTQIHQLAQNQNTKSELETTKATFAGLARLQVPQSGPDTAETQLSSPATRKYGVTLQQPSLSLEEVDQAQPSPSGPGTGTNALAPVNLDKRNSANTGSASVLHQHAAKSKQHTLQYIAPHKAVLPDEYFKKRLNNKASGLYLQLMTYRNQQVNQSQFQQYLDTMTEKAELLLEHVVPFGNSWSNKKLEDKLSRERASKKLFDDIHFGKDVLSDVQKVESLNINKICDKLLNIDIQDQDFPQNYLNFYINETVPRSAEKTTGRAPSSTGPKRPKGYQTQSPQTLQNETLKSDQSNKDLDFDGLAAEANASSKGGSILKNRMKSGKRSDKQIVLQPARSQSSNPQIAEQTMRGANSRLQKTPPEYSNIKEERGHNIATRSAPGTAMPGPRTATASRQQTKMQENAANQPLARLSRPFRVNMETKAAASSQLERGLVDRKTSTILSQDNLRSQKILDDLSKLPLKVTRHTAYQEQVQNALKTRPQSISAQALQQLNRTTPFYQPASRHQTQAAGGPAKTLINKVAGPASRLVQQTPLGSSTSTEMRYLSAKPPETGLRAHAASRNIPLNNSRTQTLGRMGDLKITILPPGGADSAAEPLDGLLNRRSAAALTKDLA